MNQIGLHQRMIENVSKNEKANYSPPLKEDLSLTPGIKDNATTQLKHHASPGTTLIERDPSPTQVTDSVGSPRSKSSKNQDKVLK